MRETNNRPLRTQYMATWHDETFDVNMMSLEVVSTRHRIRRFLRRSPVLKIKPNIGQPLGTTDKRERRKNMAKSEGPNSLERSDRAVSETSRTFENKIKLVKLWGKQIIGPWGPNIWLTDRMGLLTWTWRRRNSYVHVIIYVGFYIYDEVGMTPYDVIFTSKVPSCQLAIYWVLRGQLFLSLITSPKNNFFKSLTRFWNILVGSFQRANKS